MVERENFFVPGTTIRGQPIEIASNYVIFSSSYHETLIAEEPPEIAYRSDKQNHETWNGDSLSKAIRDSTLGKAAQNGSGRISLRIGQDSHPYPHPPIIFDLPEHDARHYRSDFMDLFAKT